VGEPPRHHQLAPGVDVGLDPAIPGDEGEKGEDEVGKES
jgi:hypothetical protein